MNILNMLADDLQQDWITKSFPIIRIVLFCIILLCSVIMIVSVLMQSNDADGGTNILSGTQESYYAQNKGASRDGKLKLITIIMASVVAVCIVLYLITKLING